jgi:hypothetical protein
MASGSAVPTNGHAFRWLARQWLITSCRATREVKLPRFRCSGAACGLVVHLLDPARHSVEACIFSREQVVMGDNLERAADQSDDQRTLGREAIQYRVGDAGGETADR